MAKKYNTAELTIVRIAARDIIVTSPTSQALDGPSTTSCDHVTDGANTSDYVW